MRPPRTWRATGTDSEGKEGVVILHGPWLWKDRFALRVSARSVREGALTLVDAAHDGRQPEGIAREFVPTEGAIPRSVKEAEVDARMGFRDQAGVTPWVALRVTLEEGFVLLTVDETYEMPAAFGGDFFRSRRTAWP